MNSIINIPYSLIDNHIKEDNRLYLSGKSYSIVKVVGRDTYIEVTYKLNS